MAKHLPISVAARPAGHRRRFRRPDLEPMERRVLLAQTFTVTSTLDDGSTGSLRWAIGQVNADNGTDVDTIAFNIPGQGVHTIAVGSLLPPITHPVIIDGYT